MGKIVSQQRLASTAVAKYLSLTKTQIKILCTVVRELSSKNGTIGLHFFHVALGRAKIQKNPDRLVLEALFQMWDLVGEERIPGLEFVLGLAPLACPDGSLTEILRFALQVSDRTGLKQITASELIVILKSKFETLLLKRFALTNEPLLISSSHLPFHLVQALMQRRPTLEIPS
jgi:hypothetical protein